MKPSLRVVVISFLAVLCFFLYDCRPRVRSAEDAESLARQELVRMAPVHFIDPSKVGAPIIQKTAMGWQVEFSYPAEAPNDIDLIYMFIGDSGWANGWADSYVHFKWETDKFLGR